MHLDESVSAAPEYSPGVVEDSEILLREMFNPQHVKDGEVVVTAVSLTELRSTGFSVHRKEYVSLEHVKKAIEVRLDKPRKERPWKDEGLAEILTEDVRSLRRDEERQFVVIDTAIPENLGHASIYAAKPALRDPEARRIRLLLLPLLQKRNSVEKIFESSGQENSIGNGRQGGVWGWIVRVYVATKVNEVLSCLSLASCCGWRTKAGRKDKEK